jgi:hypothetical protein
MIASSAKESSLTTALAFFYEVAISTNHSS